MEKTLNFHNEMASESTDLILRNTSRVDQSPTIAISFHLMFHKLILFYLCVVSILLNNTFRIRSGKPFIAVATLSMI